MSSQLLTHYLRELERRGIAMREKKSSRKQCRPDVLAPERHGGTSAWGLRKEQIDCIRGHLPTLSNFVKYFIDLALCATWIL